MKIYRSLEGISQPLPSAVTVGSFDGVHLGHQKILARLTELSRKHNLASTVVTFHPHPKTVLGIIKNHELKVITTLEEKTEIFSQLGVQQLIIIPFTREFAQLRYDQFVEDILVSKIGVKEMVVGYDHHFGKNREGSFDSLKELGSKLDFRVHLVGPYEMEGKIISSSVIRKLLEEGDVETSARYLGRYYRLKAEVVPGDGRGQQMGFPTANLKVLHSEKIIPARGVYAVNVRIEGDSEVFKGMMNIGTRPTFNLDSLTLEVHIFNLKNSIYGKIVTIEFKKFVRKEKKFQNINELKQQLEKDKEICLKV